MWDTPRGIRKLDGVERELFIAGVRSLRDRLETHETYETGVSVFDNIPYDTRRCVLFSVADALTNRSSPPRRYAWNEGAILAVFNTILEDIVAEIDLTSLGGETLFSTRRLIRAALKELSQEGGSAEDDLPEDSSDIEAWELQVEHLGDRILHDRDMMAGDVILDLPPEDAGVVKEVMGIAGDYYTVVPPAYSQEEQSRLEWVYRELMREQLD
jgi:hypothetical protein